MNVDLWKIAITLSGLGAVGAFVLLSLYKQWLSLPNFSVMTREQTYRLFRLFVICTFTFSIVAIAAYTFTSTHVSDENIAPPQSPELLGNDLVTLNLVFLNTGEKKIIQLPLDIQSGMAARQIAQENLFRRNNTAHAFSDNSDIIYTIILNGQEISQRETLREAGAKDWDTINVNIHVGDLSMSPAPSR